MKVMNLITEVQIQPIKPRDGLIAFASFVLNNELYLSSVGIHSKLNDFGYRLTYPTKLVGAREINIFHPITKELGAAIEEAMIKKLNEVMRGVREWQITTIKK